MISFYIFFPRCPSSQVTCLCKICIAHCCPENGWDFKIHSSADSYTTKSLPSFWEKRLTLSLHHGMRNNRNNLTHRDRQTDTHTDKQECLWTWPSVVAFCVIFPMLSVIGEFTLQLFLSGIVNLGITANKSIKFVTINKKQKHQFKWTDTRWSHNPNCHTKLDKEHQTKLKKLYVLL